MLEGRLNVSGTLMIFDHQLGDFCIRQLGEIRPILPRNEPATITTIGLQFLKPRTVCFVIRLVLGNSFSKFTQVQPLDNIQNKGMRQAKAVG
jgi:hypothetical protein